MAERRRKFRAFRATRTRSKSSEKSLADVFPDAVLEADAKPIRPRRILSRARHQKPTRRKKSRNDKIETETQMSLNNCPVDLEQNLKPSNEVEDKSLYLTQEDITLDVTGGRILSLNEVTDQSNPIGRRMGPYPTEQTYVPTFGPIRHQQYRPTSDSTEPHLTSSFPVMPPTVHTGPLSFSNYTPDVTYYKERNNKTESSQECYSGTFSHASPRPTYQELSCRTTEHFTPTQSYSPRYTCSVPEVSSTSSAELVSLGHYQNEERKMVCTPDEDRDLPLHIAVAKGNLREVRCLLHIMKKYTINVDAFNKLRQTPLHIAVITSNSEIMNLLLEAGASPCAPDRRGNTAVHLAAKCADRRCLESLLENSESEEVINAHNYDGFTPLHLAVLKNDREFIRILLCRGADVDIVDGTSGRGPLFHAIENGLTEVVELLLSFGANVNLPNYSGITPLVVATDKGNKTISSMLISRGAMITLRDDYS